MTVPNELMDKWKNLYSAGDFEAISGKSGFSTVTIRAAFNKGECSDRVFEAIAKFYQDKDKRIKQYL